MSEATEAVLNTANTVLTEMLQRAATAEEFILSELPSVVQQLLTWKLVESLWLCSLSFIVFPLTYYWAKAWRATFKKDLPDEGVIPPFIVGSIVLAVGCMSALFNVNIDWLQILIAPKIYLIEYAAGLVK